MTQGDVFGHDPQVRYMRRVFASIEKEQARFLEKIGIARLDERLRESREIALKYFEKIWGKGLQNGIVESEDDVATLYLYCFSYVLSAKGIPVTANALPEHSGIRK